MLLQGSPQALWQMRAPADRGCWVGRPRARGALDRHLNSGQRARNSLVQGGDGKHRCAALRIAVRHPYGKGTLHLKEFTRGKTALLVR